MEKTNPINWEQVREILLSCDGKEQCEAMNDLLDGELTAEKLTVFAYLSCKPQAINCEMVLQKMQSENHIRKGNEAVAIFTPVDVLECSHTFCQIVEDLGKIAGPEDEDDNNK